MNEKDDAKTPSRNEEDQKDLISSWELESANEDTSTLPSLAINLQSTTSQIKIENPVPMDFSDLEVSTPTEDKNKCIKSNESEL